MKILILTRHFPPEVSGGVRRWFWLSHALSEKGHDVTIVAPDLGHSDTFDPHYSTARIIRIPHTSAMNGAAQAGRSGAINQTKEPVIKSVLREVLLLPDADIRWVKYVVQQLPKILDGETFDWVVTSSPPESLHYAGYKLKGRVARRWHADIRDYWLKYPLIEARNKKLRRSFEARLARKWLSHANLRTAVDAGMAAEMEQLSGEKSVALSHFSPPNNIPSVEAEFKGSEDSVRLVYTGSFSLSDKDRKIEPLLEEYEKTCEVASNLSLHIFGKLTQDEITTAESSSARNKIFLYGSVSAERAFSAQYHSDALLINAAPNSNAVPGKLMEYRQVRKPIIAVGHGPWLVANPDIMQGRDAMILASKRKLPASAASTVNLDDICETLLSFYQAAI